MPTDEPDARIPKHANDDEFGEWLHEQFERDCGLVHRPAALPQRRSHGKLRGVSVESSWHRVQRVAARLHASRPSMPQRCVELVRMKEPNAFAVPGRYVYITTDLVRRVPNDDAIALILGHEFGHCELGHLFHFRDRLEIGDLPIGAIFSQVLYILQRLASSPDHERDADAFGLDLSLTAGYDGERCIDAFIALEDFIRQSGHDFLIEGPSGPQPDDDPLAETSARASVWVFEHATGYPPLRKRSQALKERLAQRLAEPIINLDLPGSRRLSPIEMGMRFRLERVERYAARLRGELELVGTEIGGLLRRPASRLAMTHGGERFTGRTLSVMESAMSQLHDLIQVIRDLIDQVEQAESAVRQTSWETVTELEALKIEELICFTTIDSTLAAPGSIGPSITLDLTDHLDRDEFLATIRSRLNDCREVLISVEAAMAYQKQFTDRIAAEVADLAADSVGQNPTLQEPVKQLAAALFTHSRRAESDPLGVIESEELELRRHLAETRNEMTRVATAAVETDRRLARAQSVLDLLQSGGSFAPDQLDPLAKWLALLRLAAGAGRFETVNGGLERWTAAALGLAQE